MNVLSLFDGISCAYEALQRANIEIKSYYASEIDKNAIAISERNHPDIIRLGDVKEIDGSTLPKIDLLIGGSPCIDMSVAKKNREGLKGKHSSLFWDYVRLKNQINPTHFILENVASMSKEDKETISKALGVEPVMFNASLVSAQNRKRYFWTNIKFELPEDRGIVLKDILEAEVDEKFIVNNKLTATSTQSNKPIIRIGHIGNSKGQANRVYDIEGKSVSLTSNSGGLGAKTGLYKLNDMIRRLTPIECERLMGLPDNYTNCVAVGNRYKALGNAFNVDVIADILTSIQSN